MIVALASSLVVVGLVLLGFSAFALASGLLGAAGARFVRCSRCGHYTLLGPGRYQHRSRCPEVPERVVQLAHLFEHPLTAAHIRHG